MAPNVRATYSEPLLHFLDAAKVLAENLDASLKEQDYANDATGKGGWNLSTGPELLHVALARVEQLLRVITQMENAYWQYVEALDALGESAS